MFTVIFNPKSSNQKIGKIPATRTERASCPTTCPFYNAGCYAKLGHEGMQWHPTNMKKKGIEWEQFLSYIKELKPNQIWRHNTAGDLPHQNGNIVKNLFLDLVGANTNKRGFTYTHHVLNEHNVSLIQEANKKGFSVNASTESVEVADKIMTEHNIPAVAVINSNETRRFFSTESGRKVIVCPATVYKKKVTCETCGICANPNRKEIVAFPSHGAQKNIVNQIVK